MLQKTTGIVIRNIKYSESSLICKVYTREFGLLSFFVQGVGSKKAKIKQAHLIPLNIIEIDFYNQENKNLKKIKEISCLPIHHIYNENAKRAFAMFMLEILNKALVQEEQENTELFDLCYQTIFDLENKTFDKDTFLPHYFLFHLLETMGHGVPLPEEESDVYFNLSEGVWIREFDTLSITLNIEQSKILLKFVQKGEVEAANRNLLFKILVEFFKLQCLDGKPLSSLEVLSLV